MTISKTHNEVTFTPLPGQRFTQVARVDGHAVVLEYERGKARDLVNWLHHWVDSYIGPLADAEEKASKAIKEVEALKHIEAENEKIQALRAAIKPQSGRINPSLVGKPEPSNLETIAEALSVLTPMQLASLIANAQKEEPKTPDQPIVNTPADGSEGESQPKKEQE